MTRPDGTRHDSLIELRGAIDDLLDERGDEDVVVTCDGVDLPGVTIKEQDDRIVFY